MVDDRVNRKIKKISVGPWSINNIVIWRGRKKEFYFCTSLSLSFPFFHSLKWMHFIVYCNVAKEKLNSGYMIIIVIIIWRVKSESWMGDGKENRKNGKGISSGLECTSWIRMMSTFIFSLANSPCPQFSQIFFSRQKTQYLYTSIVGMQKILLLGMVFLEKRNIFMSSVWSWFLSRVTQTAYNIMWVSLCTLVFFALLHVPLL